MRCESLHWDEIGDERFSSRLLIVLSVCLRVSHRSFVTRYEILKCEFELPRNMESNPSYPSFDDEAMPWLGRTPTLESQWYHQRSAVIKWFNQGHWTQWRGRQNNRLHVSRWEVFRRRTGSRNEGEQRANSMLDVWLCEVKSSARAIGSEWRDKIDRNDTVIDAHIKE